MLFVSKKDDIISDQIRQINSRLAKAGFEGDIIYLPALPKHPVTKYVFREPDGPYFGKAPALIERGYTLGTYLETDDSDVAMVEIRRLAQEWGI